MIVLFIEPPSANVQGDQVHRTRGPAQAMAAEFPSALVVTGTWLSEVVQRLAREADILILCQAVDLDFVPLCAQRRAAGLCTIVEINDHFCCPIAGNHAGHFFSRPSMQALMWQLAAIADGVQCSTPYLAQAYRSANAKMAVFTNVAPLALGAIARAQRPRAPSAQLRLGWGGSLGHRADLARLMGCIARVLRAHPQCVFEVMAPNAIRAALCQLPAGQWRHRACAPFAHYMNFVAGLDISLGPQEDTPFNRGRSDVKFLEAAACHTAFIGARRPAYESSVREGETGLLYGSDDELFAHLTSLIGDVSRRVRLTDAAFAYASQHRDAATDARRRWAWLRSCMPGGREGATTTASAAQAHWRTQFTQHADTLAAAQPGCALHVPLRGAELALWSASTALTDDAKNALGWQSLAEACRKRPTAMLPRLVAATTRAGLRGQASPPPTARDVWSSSPENELESLRQHFPASHAVASAQVRVHERSDPPRALALAKALSEGSAATCASVWWQRAALEERLGDYVAATSSSRQALQVSPHLWPAAVVATRCLLAKAHARSSFRLASAIRIAAAAAGAHVHAPEPCLLWARLLLRSKRWRECQVALHQAQERLAGCANEGALAPEIHALSAQTWAKLGDRDQAQAHLQLAKQWLHPSPQATSDSASSRL